MLGRGGKLGAPPGYGGPGFGTPYGNQIPEVDEDDYEDLQLFPFDDPTEEDVLWMAQLIGIHPIRDQQFMYLAKEALINPPSEEWMIFKDIAGNVIWINDITEEMEPHPPHLRDLIENFQRVKKKAATMSGRNTSNDKSNAMKKLLGRNLATSEVIEETPPPPPQIQPTRAQAQSTRPTSSMPASKPTQEPPQAIEQPAGKRGGGMSLLKALAFAKDEEEKTPASQPSNKKLLDNQHPNRQQTVTAKTESVPTRGAQPQPAKLAAKMPEPTKPSQQKQTKPLSESAEEDVEEENDSVLERVIGKDDDYDDVDEIEDDEEDIDDDEKGMVVGDANEDGEEEQSAEEASDQEDLEQSDVEHVMEAASKGTQPTNTQYIPKQTAQTHLKAKEMPSTKAAVKPEKSSKSPVKTEAKMSQAKKKAKQAPQSEAELQNSKMLDKLMSEFQDMQMKMSRIEEENKSLRRKNEEFAKSKTESQQTSQVPPPTAAQVRPVHDSEDESHNIKSGILEIKKLLEQSILIQNDKSTGFDRLGEENKSIIVNGPSDSIRAEHASRANFGMTPFGVHSHDQSLSELHRNSKPRFGELDAKWHTIISREREHMQMTRLNLQNDKIILENRKLSIKKHEFEMSKELEQMKLVSGHPLAGKIKENLVQQLGIFKNEYASWRDKCMRFTMKQKNLALLDKSYQFSKSAGSISDAADKHLEELYSIFRESFPDDTASDLDKELGFNPAIEESLDSHPADMESEQNPFDDNQSKSDKQSVREFITKATSHNHDPTDFNYNVDEIRQSMVGSYHPSRSVLTEGYDRLDPNKDNIKRYFANQSRFYDSMKREVEGMVNRYSTSGSNYSRPSYYY